MNHPKCPYCGYEFDNEDIWHTGATIFPKEQDGDEEDTECLSCGEPLKIMLNLEPSWVFLDENYEEMHG